MQKHIIILGAGRSATCLIDYLLGVCNEFNWQLTVAESNYSLASSKIGASHCAKAVVLDVENETERSTVVQSGDLVISLLPAGLHYHVAKDCLQYGKHLLTASYAEPEILALNDEVRKKKLLFLCEMGLDPGIDHMSAMQLINDIHSRGGKISAFKSHCGGLVAPESDDNPWHYKISWNPRNVVMAGSSGAIFRQDKEVKTLSYGELFRNCGEVDIKSGGRLAYYPNRDSLTYSALYGLQETATFVRSTLRHPSFCVAWDALVQAGLTSAETSLSRKGMLYREWSVSLLPFLNNQNRPLLEYLGLFDDTPLPALASTNADALQHLLESRLFMHAEDKDMIVMLHQIEFELKAAKYHLQSLLVVKGYDNIRTAMAKTVGLPLGIAAKLILLDQLSLHGVHIPVHREIYEPILKELSAHGIRFDETIEQLPKQRNAF